MAGKRGGKRDDAEVSRFIERFASALIEAGFPRVAALVFVALLVSDFGLTAAELSERLRVSPASVSGAVRYLVHLGLVGREREPGSRRDRYFALEDAWRESSIRQDEIMARWLPIIRDGMRALAPESPAGERLAETLAFIEFVREETPGLIERWRARRAALRQQRLPLRYR